MNETRDFAAIEDGHLTTREVVLMEENMQLRKVLERIARWPYDIMGDCVADARREAQEALRGGEVKG